MHATIFPFSITKYLWQRIINLLRKHIEINKFSINHIFHPSGGVVIGQIRNAIAHSACDDGKYCVVNIARTVAIISVFLIRVFVNTTTSVTNGCLAFGRIDLDTRFVGT